MYCGSLHHFLLFNFFENALRIVGLFEMLFEKITNTASWSASFSLVIFFLFAFVCQPRPLHIEVIILTIHHVRIFQAFHLFICEHPCVVYRLSGFFRSFLIQPLSTHVPVRRFVRKDKSGGFTPSGRPRVSEKSGGFFSPNHPFILIGFSMISHHPFWGFPHYFWKHPCSQKVSMTVL